MRKCGPTFELKRGSCWKGLCSTLVCLFQVRLRDFAAERNVLSGTPWPPPGLLPLPGGPAGRLCSCPPVQQLGPALRGGPRLEYGGCLGWRASPAAGNVCHQFFMKATRYTPLLGAHNLTLRDILYLSYPCLIFLRSQLYPISSNILSFTHL